MFINFFNLLRFKFEKEQKDKMFYENIRKRYDNIKIKVKAYVE
jgi:hypothetical protein